MGCFLGIDTSNYTTSAAVCTDSLITANEKIPVTVKSGMRGVRQSEAVFSHVKNLPVILEKIGKLDLDAIAVSLRPRDSQGSYMPCFLPGYAAAKAIASVNGLPLFSFSHQAGHISAAIYSSGRADLLEGRFIAFHISGGTTDLLLCEKNTITRIGGSIDITAGQLIDRVGVMLGYDFPCGKNMDFAACGLYDDIKPKVSANGMYCNFSGLENKASELLSAGNTPGYISAYIIKSIACSLNIMTRAALEKYGSMPVLFSGGVASNSYLKSFFSDKFDCAFASPEFSADNAAGIALLCERHFNAQK